MLLPISVIPSGVNIDEDALGFVAKSALLAVQHRAAERLTRGPDLLQVEGVLQSGDGRL